MIGEKIGHFTIKHKLGEGGMGAVYLAEHDIMRKKVAIKILLPQWTQSAVIVQRFRNEAIAMAELQHPNIVAIDDCGQLPSGAWYIIMEYLDGGSLSRFCKSHGPLSEHVVLHILCQAAAALEAAHKRGIVHRDLKLENIFLIAKKGNPHFVKVLDWGISKLGEQQDGHGITNVGMVAGTPAYMAPEQILDLRTVDRRTDVFALGAIAYRMLAGGWLPFQRSDRPHEFSNLSLTAIRDLQMRENPIPLRQRVAEVNERIESAILSALHRDPARRPQTARQFILLLAAAVRGDDDGFNLSGADIVKEYAPELLEIGNLEETVRSLKPSEKRKESRYRFGDQLGAGGMAEVFRATHVGAEGFSRQVAIKRVLPGFSSTPQFATMFVQEAKLASLLDHPNIVAVLDFDRDDEGRLFLTMEYVAGRDLASVSATGPLPISTIIFIVSEMLSGLGYAHNLPVDNGPSGLIHRDVSPQNVLLSWEGAVKVSDFGIAKARHASEATASMMIKGKPQYMSPEQANGEALDGRSDLFAVGIVLWELLTGRHLFDNGTTQETFAQIFFRPIPPPSAITSDVSRDLDAVTMRLLAREKEVRYTVAEDVIEDLARCADAPRNGRAELVRLLAERFPDVRGSRPPPGRASQPPLVRASQPPGNAPHAASTLRIPPPPNIPARPSHTTLGGAASQSMTARGLRRAVPILAGIFVGVAVLVGVGVYVKRSNLTPEAASAWPADAPPSVDAPSETELTITTDPAGSIVRIDDADRGTSPVTLRIPKGRRITISARRDGYAPVRQIVVMNHDAQAIALTLHPAMAPADAGVSEGSAATSRKTGSAGSVPRRGSRGSGDKSQPAEKPTFNPDDAVD